jgi:hypothetical protein
VTLGGERGYDSAGFVKTLRGLQVTPHVAQNTTHRQSAIDARTTRHEGCAVSQQKRKRMGVSPRLDEDSRSAAPDQVPGPDRVASRSRRRLKTWYGPQNRQLAIRKPPPLHQLASINVRHPAKPEKAARPNCGWTESGNRFPFGPVTNRAFSKLRLSLSG